MCIRDRAKLVGIPAHDALYRQGVLNVERLAVVLFQQSQSFFACRTGFHLSLIHISATCWWLALVAMAIIVVANIWGKGMVKIIPSLLGVVGSYIVAVIATLCGACLLYTSRCV